MLTSCGYWETFTSEDSWTRVGQWLYEVEKFFQPYFSLQWRISSDKKLILWLQVKAEMVLGRLVQKDGHLATDVDGNPRKVRLGQRQMQS